MKEDRGKLIYEAPNYIFKRNLKSDLISVFLVLTMFIFYLSFLIFLFTYNPNAFLELNEATFILYLGIFLFLFFSLFYIRQSRLTKFKVYENGFIPESKPLRYLITSTDYFISFNDIIELNYIGLGIFCKLKLSNGYEEEIDIDCADVKGFISFYNVLEKSNLKSQLPDFETFKSHMILNLKLENILQNQ